MTLTYLNNVDEEYWYILNQVFYSIPKTSEGDKGIHNTGEYINYDYGIKD